MEDDILFEKLKESVWLSRRKIRKCKVKKKDHAETRISWNSIWNELKKTDWCASEELIQRLKVWYSFSEPSDIADDRCEKRDLSQTLPAFLIESLVHSEDHWDQEPSLEIASSKKESIPDNSKNKLQGKSKQQQIYAGQAQEELKVSLESVALPSEHFAAERQTAKIRLNALESQMTWSAPKLSRLNHLAPEFTPAKVKTASRYRTTLNKSTPHQKYEVQSKAPVKEHWCPPDGPPAFEKKPIFKPSEIRETFTRAKLEEWKRKKIENRNFPENQVHSPRGTFSQRRVENRKIEEMKTKRFCSKLDLPTRSSHGEFQPHMKHSNTNYNSPQQFCKRNTSTHGTRKMYRLENPNRNNHSSPSSQKIKQIHNRRNIRSTRKSERPRIKDISPPKQPGAQVFPPKGYIWEKGDWLVHAIVSLSSTPNDVKLALSKRGYKLKYIMKRKCTLPSKWVCSLIANADRTHILTSENIWINSWEVEFVCGEDEIAPFLVSTK